MRCALHPRPQYCTKEPDKGPPFIRRYLFADIFSARCFYNSKVIGIAYGKYQGYSLSTSLGWHKIYMGETMNTIGTFATAVLLSMTFMGTAVAADKGTKEEAIALTKKAIALYKSAGKEKAYAEINDKSGQFVDRDLYVYVVDTTGHVRAHGTNPKLIDKDLSLLKDADGKNFIAELMANVKANKSGWVDYKWTHPISKQIEAKTTYIEPVGDLGFAVGVYK